MNCESDLMSEERKYRQRDWLHREYILNGRTLTDIGNECGVTPMTIHMWLDRLGLPTRPRGIHRGGKKPQPRFRGDMVSIDRKEYERLLAIEKKWEALS